MKATFFLQLLQLILALGTGLLLVFIVLSGGVNHFPFDEFYWLQGDTSGIANAPDFSRWTYWGIATVENDKSIPFSLGPAVPISPVDNFGTTTNVPPKFVSNENALYYLSRVGFAMYWVALAFVGVSMFTIFFAFCFAAGVKISSWLFSAALLFTATGSALMTAAVVIARNAFNDADLHSRIGRSMLGLTWGATATLIVLFLLGCSGAIKQSYGKYRADLAANKERNAQYLTSEQEGEAQVPQGEEQYAQQNQGTLAGQESGIKFFKIRRHNKDDTESV